MEGDDHRHSDDVVEEEHGGEDGGAAKQHPRDDGPDHAQYPNRTQSAQSRSPTNQPRRPWSS
jgi:hypothetical protein